jgi:hypothetical protein
MNPSLNGAVLLGNAPAVLSKWCNPFGYETGGAKTYLGAPIQQGTQVTQWNCKNRSIGRFRFTCPHGHKGHVMELCASHARQFKTRTDKGDMSFCPTCNVTSDHKCRLSLLEIS